MKAIRTYLIGLMMLIGTSAFAQPMNYNAMRNNARFLTDRMAYTLGITSLDLIDDLYRINFDYIYSINDYLDDIALGYRYDDYMSICAERDFALRMLLGDLLWNRIVGYDYFYRPILFENHRWRFHIYAYDYNIHHYYCHIPTHFNHYHGGHYITHMHPHRGIGERGPGMARWDSHRSTMVRGGERGGMTRGDRTSVNRGGDYNRGGDRGGVTRGDRSSYNRGGDRGSYNRNDRSEGVTRGDRGEGMRGGERPEGGRGGDRPSVTPGNERPNANMGERPTERPSATPSRGSESRTQGNMQSSSRGSYGESSRGGSYSGSRSSSSGSYGGSRGSSSGSYGGSTRSSSSGSFGGSRGGSYGGGSRGGSTGGGMSRGGRR